MSMDDQGTKRRRKIAENFNRLSRVHERYRQTADGRAVAYSEREREFTFAKMTIISCCQVQLYALASAKHKSFNFIIVISMFIFSEALKAMKPRTVEHQ